MRRVSVRITTFLVAFLIAISSFVVFTAITHKVSALEESEVKANTTLKVEFNIPKEAQVGGTLAAGTIINKGVSFFNWIGDGNVGLKPGYSIAYDVYSPTPVAGLGMFSGAEQDGKWRMWDEVVKNEVDEEGYAYGSDADISEVMGNGWYSRNIKLGEALTTPDGQGNGGLASSHWATFLETKAPVPYEKLTVYFKNVRILDEKGAIMNYCFYKGQSEDRYATSKYHVPTKIGVPSLEDKSYMYTPPEGDPASEVVTEGTRENVNRIKTDIAFVENINPVTVSFKEAVQGINKDINLVEIANLDGATVNSIKVFEVKDDGARGEEVAVADNKINVAKMGKYKVEYWVTKGELKSFAAIDLYTVDPSVPFIFEKDTSVIQKVFEEKTEISLPKIKVYYKSDKQDVVPSVKQGDKTVAVTTKDDCYTFTPSEFDDYSVVYSFTDSSDATKTVATKPVVIRVGVLKFDLSELKYNPEDSEKGMGEIGTAYDLSKVKANDPKNGAVNYEVYIKKGTTAIDVTEKDGKPTLFTDIPGEYEVTFTAVNFMKEAVSSKLVVDINAIEGMITKLKISVPEPLRAEGELKQGQIRVFGWLEGAEAFGMRDTLNYEIFMPEPIPGVGFVDFLGDDSIGWGKFSETGDKLTGNEKDKDGNAFTPSADLTKFLKDKDGKPIWYKRTINMPKCYTNKPVDMVMYFDTTAAVGEFIEVYVRNVYTESEDGIIKTYYNGEQTTQKPSILSAKELPVPGGYNVAAEALTDSLKVTIDIPETHRGEVEKSMLIRLFGWQEKAGIPAGAKISYTIKMDNPIAGVGYMDFYGNGTGAAGWNALSTLLPSGLKDSQNIAYAPDADLSAKLGDWYTREISANEISGSGLCDAVLKIKTSAAVPSGKIVLYIKDIKFIGTESSVTYFENNNFVAAPTITESNISASDLPPAPAKYAVTGSSVYDDAPMLYKLNLPENNQITAGKEYTFGELAYDYINREFVDYTLTVTDKSNKPITVTGKKFTPPAAGDYKVTITANNEAGSLIKKFIISATDSVKPVIGEMTNLTAVAGKEYKITLPEVTDDVTAKEDIEIIVSVVDPDGNAVELKDNTFTPSKAGTYKINIVAADKANNTVTKSFELVVTKEEGCAGCGGAAIPLIGIFACLGLGFIFRRKAK